MNESPSIRIPLQIFIQPYIKDHRINGKAVLPAVESLRLLAESTRSVMPDLRIHTLVNAQFRRFLSIEPEATLINAFNEIEMLENGNVRARLITISHAKSSAIKRSFIHAAVTFLKKPQPMDPIPVDIFFSLEGIIFEIASEKLYAELVPFGPAFQNILKSIAVSKNGGLAEIDGGMNTNAASKLGSTFPLDAAFHAACVWCQRYCGIVGFPVGFDRRIIMNPTQPGKKYFSRIIPTGINHKTATFDIWICDDEARCNEAVFGVLMQDVSGGKIVPPKWIGSSISQNEFMSFQDHCSAFSLIELKTIKQAARYALSPFESLRLERMGEKRRLSYLAARLACKSLSRKLSQNDTRTPAQNINTVAQDQVRPFCPHTTGDTSFYCSVSHDSRFAIAIGAAHPVGVDIETLSERVVNIRKYFMNEDEFQLADQFRLGNMAAAIRIWTIKEAVSKAMDINLTECWKRTNVIDIGEAESALTVDGICFKAYHETVDEHLFTVFVNPNTKM